MMHLSFESGLFVTGTDTDVGKTYVACEILRHLAGEGRGVGAYKPVVSGADDLLHSDAGKLHAAMSSAGAIEQVTPQFFRAPLAPPIAAELEGRVVDEQRVLDGFDAWRGASQGLIVEGAGGLFSPISSGWTNAQLAVHVGFPLVVVTENRLGSVHQVLVTLMAAKQLGLPVACVVLNQVHPAKAEQQAAIETNERLLRSFLSSLEIDVAVTALGYEQRRFSPPIDWWKLGTDA